MYIYIYIIYLFTHRMSSYRRTRW